MTHGGGDNDGLYDEIHRLVCLQAEGRLTAADARRLETLVVGDPAARRLYADYVRESAILRWYAEAHEPAGAAESAGGRPDEELMGVAISDAVTGETEDDEPAAETVAPYVMPVPEEPPRRSRRWWYAAAAGLVVGLGVAGAVLLRSRPAPVEVGTVAYASMEATWDGPATAAPPRRGDRVRAGAGGLRRGTVRVALDGGAEVTVIGPARFEMRDGAAMTLVEGQLAAKLRPGAKGLTVRTPSAEVVDLGTEFGVRVERTGATEVHVMSGHVDFKAASGAGAGTASRLTASSAARVEAGGTSVEAVPCRPLDFAAALPQIDLADVVAGGDGTTGRRGAGIDAETGARVTAGRRAGVAGRGDGQFRAFGENPMVAGVFVPAAGGTMALDPAGHADASPPTAGGAAYWLWAGGTIPLVGDSLGLAAIPGVLGGVDYGGAGHGLLYVPANQGVTFDLSAIRAAHPGRAFGSFRAVCGNSAAGLAAGERTIVSERSALRVYADGVLVLEREIRRTAGPFPIDLAIPGGAKYLTVVVTDGGDGYHADWVVLGDPRLE